MTDTGSMHRDKIDATVARDWDRLRALYHAEYTYTDGSGEPQDTEAAIAACGAYTTALPDLSVEILHQHSPSADVSILEYAARGTHLGDLGGIAPTGKPVQILVCNVVEARDGQIIRERDYYDVMSIMQQLGAAGG